MPILNQLMLVNSRKDSKIWSKMKGCLFIHSIHKYYQITWLSNTFSLLNINLSTRQKNKKILDSGNIMMLILMLLEVNSHKIFNLPGGGIRMNLLSMKSSLKFWKVMLIESKIRDQLLVSMILKAQKNIYKISILEKCKVET